MILRALRIILIISCFISTNEVKASHLMGAEIGWKCIGKDSFLITATIYRDCSGINLTSVTPNVSCITGGSFSFSNTLLGAPVDITPVCAANCSRCESSSCSFSYGIQEFIWTGIVDLSSATCCNFDVSLQISARNSYITTGAANQNFYISAILNTCDSICNNSPVFTNTPLMLVCVGQCIIYNQGAVEYDGDSLVYSLTPPLQTASTATSYTGSYAYNKPLYFDGFPNQNLAFNPPQCRGFHLDSVTGDLKFRPMKSEVTILAIKVEEYRNGVKIGEVTRDIQIIILNCPNNAPPNLSGINGSTSQFTIDACPGQEVCFDLTTSDANSSDSVKLSWHPHNIIGATFTITQNGKYQDGRFCWTPSSKDIRTMPYLFTVTAEDDVCPIISRTIRSYQINVSSQASISGSLGTSIDSCNIVSFSSGIDTTLTDLQWQWSGEAGFSDTVRNPVFKYDTTGTFWYYLKATPAGGGCGVFYDSAQVTIYPKPAVDAGTYNDLCDNGPGIALSGTPSGGTWSGTGVTTNGFDPVATGAGNYTLTYSFVDGNGCTRADSVTITVNAAPTATFTASPASGNSPLQVNFTNQSQGDNLRYFWTFGDTANSTDTIKDPSFTFQDTSRIYDVTLTVTDTITGCADTMFCNGCVEVLSSVGIIESSFSQKFKVFPNPAQNELTISGDVAIKEVQVTDLSGKTVIKTAVNREKMVKLDLTTLAVGNYLVYITTEEGIAIKKVVVGR